MKTSRYIAAGTSLLCALVPLLDGCGNILGGQKSTPRRRSHSALPAGSDTGVIATTVLGGSPIAGEPPLDTTVGIAAIVAGNQPATPLPTQTAATQTQPSTVPPQVSGTQTQVPSSVNPAERPPAPPTALPPPQANATISVFDTSNAEWFIHFTNTAGAPDLAPFRYGSAGDIPVAGDWNGDGKGTIGVFSPSTATWALRDFNSIGAPTIAAFAYGPFGSLPIVGDWTASGRVSIGVVERAASGNLKFYLRNAPTAGAADNVFEFGAATWTPVAGDWDGDGRTTIGAFDPATATWYLRNTNSAGAPDMAPFVYGNGQWMPVAGDWDGDGRATIGMGEPNSDGLKWYLRNDNSEGEAHNIFSYGGVGAIPIAAKWDRAGFTVVDPNALDNHDLATLTVVAGDTTWRRLEMHGYDQNGNDSLWPKTLRFEYGFLMPEDPQARERLAILPGAFSLGCRTPGNLVHASRDVALEFDLRGQCALMTQGELSDGFNPVDGWGRYQSNVPTVRSPGGADIVPETWGSKHWRRNYSALVASAVSASRILFVGQGLNSNVKSPAGDNLFYQNSIKDGVRVEEGCWSGYLPQIGWHECWEGLSSFVNLFSAPVGGPYDEANVTDFGPVLWTSHGTYSQTGAGERQVSGTGSPPWPTSLVVKDNFAYLYFFQFGCPGVARAPLLPNGDVAAGDFYYYFNGDFTQKALPIGFSKDTMLNFRNVPGGQFTCLLPAGSEHGLTTFFDVAHIRNSNVWVALHEHTVPGGAPEVEGAAVDLLFSRDLIHWTRGPAVETVVPQTWTDAAGHRLGCGWGCSLFTYARFLSKHGYTAGEIDPEEFYLLGTSANSGVDLNGDGDTDIHVAGTPEDLPYGERIGGDDGYLLHTRRLRLVNFHSPP